MPGAAGRDCSSPVPWPIRGSASFRKDGGRGDDEEEGKEVSHVIGDGHDAFLDSWLG